MLNNIVKETFIVDRFPFEKFQQFILLLIVLSLQDFSPKLSDFGLAKAGPTGDMTHVSTQIMGTQGYAAPEYIATGKKMLSYLFM